MKIKFYQCDCGEDVYENDEKCLNCFEKVDQSKFKIHEVSEVTQTFSSTKPNIDPASIEEAIKILENQKNNPSYEELYKMIATLASMRGIKTMTSKYLPKDMLVIGTAS